MAGGHALQPSRTAATVRHKAGKRQVQDGPYAEAKERLGGFYVVDVPDLETALEWAARCPAAGSGAVEVRPNLAMRARPAAPSRQRRARPTAGCLPIRPRGRATSRRPKAAKVAQKEVRSANKMAIIPPWAMGANICGVITSAIIAGIYVSLLR